MVTMETEIGWEPSLPTPNRLPSGACSIQLPTNAPVSAGVVRFRRRSMVAPGGVSAESAIVAGPLKACPVINTS